MTTEKTFKDFEKIAEFLEEQSRNFPKAQREVALRRAISTIYYGVFWELRQRLRRRGIKIRKRQPHSTILKILETNFPEIYASMEELKKLRELADYQEDVEITLPMFKRAKNLARLILKGV
jgi:uncharacterized protein (UPF0332 family)